MSLQPWPLLSVLLFDDNVIIAQLFFFHKQILELRSCDDCPKPIIFHIKGKTMSSQVTQLGAAKVEETSRWNCLLSFIGKWSWIFPLRISIRLERVYFFAPWFWCYSPHMDYWRTISPSFLQDPGVCLSSVRIAFVFDTEMVLCTWIQPVWNELLLL